MQPNATCFLTFLEYFTPQEIICEVLEGGDISQLGIHVTPDLTASGDSVEVYLNFHLTEIVNSCI